MAGGMDTRYCDRKKMKFESPDSRLMINGVSVASEKHKKYLKLGKTIIILPIKSLLFLGNTGKTASFPYNIQTK